MDVKSKLINYYKNNGFIQKYIKGLNASTNEIVLSYNGITKNITIEELEKITDETSIINFINGIKESPVIEEKIEQTIEEPKVIEAKEVNEVFESTPETLNDIKILTELKNKAALDNILRKFAINETTGLIDINKAINIVEENTIKAVINSIKESYTFDLNAINYDIKGNFIGEKIPDAISSDEKIVSSFNNIRVYLEAAKMYPEQINYSEEDINKKLGEYISKVKGMLNNKAPEVKKPEIKATPNPINQVNSNNVMETRSAGFADVLVLSLIVLVYAIIIVNLILKLS